MKHLDIKEFQESGFLMEVNRRLFHPLGLALEVVKEADGTYRLGGIQDFNDEPEGVRFGEFTDEEREKLDALTMRINARLAKRQQTLGYLVQPYREHKWNRAEKP